MPAVWQFSFKPTFLHELNALESRASAQVLKKLDALAEDPTPDGHAKKQLRHLDGKLHRLRSGDYRIFYTFLAPFVSLLSVKRRNEQTYEDDVPTEFLGGAAIADLNAEPALAGDASTWAQWLGPAKARGAQLPRAIDRALLEALRVPERFHAALRSAATEDDLLDAPVPQDVLAKVIDAVTGRPIEQVASQPDLVLEDREDLLRYREGELIGFLLRLEPEQEKLVRWGLTAKGATLLKGGPGSGKSTVALYRVREVLGALKKAKVAEPKVLFTTFTRALTRVSEQLLRSLVGPEDMAGVEVRTADAILRQLAVEGGAPTVLAREPKQALARAIEEASFQGTPLKIASQKEAVAKLSRDFLLDEVLGVIEGRGLSSRSTSRRRGRGGASRSRKCSARPCGACARPSSRSSRARGRRRPTAGAAARPSA